LAAAALLTTMSYVVLEVGGLLGILTVCPHHQTRLVMTLTMLQRDFNGCADTVAPLV
jgi:hypothetical protein